jgi:hypothetical protein
MNRTDPRAWASLGAELHAAARAARAVADDRDAAPAPAITAGVVNARPAYQEARHMPRPRAVPEPPGSTELGGLPARFFRGLYRAWDLHCIDGIHVAVPKGTAFLAARTLAELARQIGDHTARGSVPERSEVSAAGPAGRTR